MLLATDGSSLLSLMLWNGVLLPALTSAACLLLTWPLWRLATKPRSASWPLALAVGLGYLVGQVRIEGWRPFPPREAADRLWYLALAAAVLGSIEGGRYVPRFLRWVLRSCLWLAVVWAMLPPSLRKEAPIKWLIGLGVVGLAYWLLLALTARRSPPLTVPLIALLVSLASVVVLFAGHSLKLAQLAGILAAALFPVVLRSAIRPPVEMTTAPLVVLLPGLWLLSYFYASDGEQLVSSYFLLALASLAGILGVVPGMRTRCAWLRSLACLLLAIALSAWAVALARDLETATDQTEADSQVSHSIAA